MKKIKELHKRQLIDKLIDYFRPEKISKKRIRECLDIFSYRKIKKICKILEIYEKYYDDSNSCADDFIDWITGV